MRLGELASVAEVLSFVLQKWHFRRRGWGAAGFRSCLAGAGGNSFCGIPGAARTNLPGTKG